MEDKVCPLLTIASAKHKNQPMCYCIKEKCVWYIKTKTVGLTGREKTFEQPIDDCAIKFLVER